MIGNVLCLFIFTTAQIGMNMGSYCGCKVTRACYKTMLDNLLDRDEVPCIEEVNVLGTSTITVFLKALKQYCGDIIDVHNEYMTYERRYLYEVEVKSKPQEVDDTGAGGARPVILIDAGQEGGYGPVDLALFVIEQLVACEEYDEMIQKAHWVILPCVNPDGFNFVKFKKEKWSKNFRLSKDGMSYGTDISRNFNESWATCSNSANGFAVDYPGPSAASENETLFVISVFNKYSDNLKAYLSLRRNGHSILYPYASVNSSSAEVELAKKKAGDIVAKVNYRAGSVQWFVNDSIFNMNGNARCGHSVDYAFNNHHVPYSYEMRVFLESDRHVLERFQKLPSGYDASLRNGYFSGIREIYNAVVNIENKRTNIV